MQWSLKSEDVEYPENLRVSEENRKIVNRFLDLLMEQIGTLVSNKIETRYWIPETEYFGEKYFAYSDESNAIHRKGSLFRIMQLSRTPEEKKIIQDFLAMDESEVYLYSLFQHIIKTLETDLKPLGFFMDYQSYHKMNESELYPVIPAISICDARFARHLIRN